MKVGDLVRLSPRKTRKGFTYESMIGLIVDMTHDPVLGHMMCSVNFGGVIYDFGMTELDVVKNLEL